MNLWTLLVSCISSLSAPFCSAHVAAPLADDTGLQQLRAQVVVLIATDRPESNTRHVAEDLVAAYNDVGLSVQLFSVTDFGAGFYAPTAYAEKPAVFRSFNEAVLAAQRVVIVTPEYNATVPAPLTRVINLLSYPDSFQDKKFSIVSLSVSPWAASRAHEQLKRILIDLHADVQDECNLKVPEVQNVTKGSMLYSEHAEKIAQSLQN